MVAWNVHHNIKTKKLTLVECVGFYIILSRLDSSGHWHNQHTEVVYHHKDVPHGVPYPTSLPNTITTTGLFSILKILSFSECFMSHYLVFISWMWVWHKNCGSCERKEGKGWRKEVTTHTELPSAPWLQSWRRALRAGCRASMTLELLSSSTLVSSLGWCVGIQDEGGLTD